VKTFRLWLLMLVMLAAMTLTAPLGAEEISSPDARWHATTGQPSPVHGAQVDGGAINAAENAPAAPLALLLPPVIAVQPSDDQESHLCLKGVSGVVNGASNAGPLSVGEKWKLFFRQNYNPCHFARTALSAAVSQARDDLPAYGQGMEGYGKRYGAEFGDSGLGAFFGRFLLPSLLHDDPRYFRKGSGPFVSRLLHAAGGAVITRRDNGMSRPNYSNILGGFIAGGIGNLYYPENERGAGATFARGAGIAASISIGNVLKEFWPDIHDRSFKKHK
jgi:hypothetical protein